MTGRLDGKIAIISGGARGQGAAEAARFVAEGARVVIGDVLHEQATATAATLGDAAVAVALDVTDEDQWHVAVATCVERFGLPDVLVNNAGIVAFHQLLNTPVDEFRRLLDVNLVGTFLGMRVVAPSMVEAGSGSIVNISSTGGLTGMPAVGAYVASKFGVTGLTKSAAMELGPRGVRVNSVHPGSIETPMVMFEGLTPDDFAPFYDRLPIKRLGSVDDVASLVLFLASDESSYCTGAEFVVDGGQTCGDHGLLTGS
jgi:3alpha(or 20beta)-hydroxysteroid dehydrogenase